MSERKESLKIVRKSPNDTLAIKAGFINAIIDGFTNGFTTDFIETIGATINQSFRRT